MAHQPPTKKQMEVMAKRLANPHFLSQAEVIRQLKLSDSNEYYRIFERCIIANRKDSLKGGSY